MNTHLILIEGNPFTGKSTLSEYVAQQLDLNGHPAHWVNEGVMLQQHFRHVLATIEGQERIQEPLLRDDWQAFVEAVRSSSSIFVVDAALSFAAVLPLLAADRPAATIHAELKHIAELCAVLRPRVIHLTGDAAQLTYASFVERGADWQEQITRQSDAFPYQQSRGRTGVDGAIAFLEDAEVFMRRVLVDDGWDALTLDVSRVDWATNRRAVLDFLGLSEVTIERPTLTSEQLRAYTGTYVSDSPDRAGETLSVQLEQETLALHGARTRYGPLLPVSPTRFHLQASRLDVEFEADEQQTWHLRLLTPDGSARVYRRA
jgi:hypothetical protein